MTARAMRAVAWLRRDLRLRDHAPLAAAGAADDAPALTVVEPASPAGAECLPHQVASVPAAPPGLRGTVPSDEVAS
ncbi:MAG: deoxyribodipyrimidine photo-lyase [Burkholderiales bacterium]|nr:deoxyribodipyrimidine photo-lyase [Burkholderiales bacterium]